MEYLENIEEGKTELTKLSRKPSPLLSPESYDPDRLTDYPRAQSPPRAHSPIGDSRRSSLSAVSESSLTSDNSSIMSYNANKMPTKKILKHPHRKRKHNKNRVRWKDEESDTVSMRSFDSISTTSEIYTRARNGVTEVRQNWREFERSPAQGSVGLTPSGARGLRPPQHSPLSNSSLLNTSITPSPSNSFTHYLLGGSPGVHTGTRQRSVSASSLPQIPANKELSNFSNNPPHSASRAFQRSPSPLTGSAFIPLSLQRTLQSTPKPHHQSDSFLVSTARRSMENSPTSPSNNSDIDLPYPVLKIDNSNLTELEESTAEDRKKMHIFKFPQNTPISKAPLYTGGQRVAKMPPPVFLDDDDEGDYDHLSPKEESNDEQNAEGSIDKPEATTSGQKDMQGGDGEKNERSPENEDEGSYSDKDIEAALDELEDRSASSTSSSNENPPTLPPKDGAVQDGEECSNEADISLSMFEDEEQLNWQVNHTSSSLSGSQETPERALTSSSSQQRAATVKINSKKVVIDSKELDRLPRAGVEEPPSDPSVITTEDASPQSAKVKGDVTSSPSQHACENLLPPKTGAPGTEVPLKMEIATKTESSIRSEEGDQKLPSKPKPPPIAPKPIRAKGSQRTDSVLIGSSATASAHSPHTVSTRVSTKGERQHTKDSQDQNTNLAPQTQDLTTPSSTHDTRPLPSNKEKTAPVSQVEYTPHSQEDAAPPKQGKVSPPQQITHPNQEEIAPPPLPTKTKRIRRQDRDISGQPLPPPMLDAPSHPHSSHSFASADESPSHAVEDILPPPPEFAFPSSPPDSSNSDNPPSDPTSHDVLDSASSSTLVPDREDALEARQILELDQCFERDTCSSSSSSSSLSHRSNKHSWSVIHHNKTRERTTSRSSESISPPGSSVGSTQEDTEGSHSKGLDTMSWSRVQDSEFPSSSAGINGTSTSISSSSVRTANLSTRLVPHHAKRSMETALLEGSILHPYTHHSSHRKHHHNCHFNDRGPDLGHHQEPFTNGNSSSSSSKLDGHLGPSSGYLDSHTKHRHHQHHSQMDGQVNERVPNPLQLRRVPNRHAPPPPVPPHLTAKLSGDERKMLHLVHLNKPRMMKPVVHDTDRHIKEMLAEIDSDNSRKKPNPTSYGKPISPFVGYSEQQFLPEL